MTEPTTTNVGLIIPNTGDLSGVWGSAALNPDFSAVDGYFGGVQTISVSNANITLTAPAGFTPTPSGGPTQAQNGILSFTGVMTANVQVTLPLPGSYIVENLTTGNFVLTFAAANAGQVVAVDQGESLRLYNNGTNVRFVGLGRIGHTEIWAGLSGMPAWVTACTTPPYLLCDGSVHNFSDFPYLGKRLVGAFGGNGITTFGVPDLRGRVPLPYDGTGTRITAGVCGINGQIIGAAADFQGITLAASQIPTITSTGSASVTVFSTVNDVLRSSNTAIPTNISGGSSPVLLFNASVSQSLSIIESTGSGTASVESNNTGSGSHPNVQPAQVTGIAVIRAA